PGGQGERLSAEATHGEVTAAAAVQRIELEFESLPFVIDPLDSLRPAGPNARLEGNVWVPPSTGAPPGPEARPVIQTLKWTEQDFEDEREGRLPMGKPTESWEFGDVDAGFREAALVLDETVVVQSTTHHPMETRSAM